MCRKYIDAHIYTFMWKCEWMNSAAKLLGITAKSKQMYCRIWSSAHIFRFDDKWMSSIWWICIKTEFDFFFLLLYAHHFNFFVRHWLMMSFFLFHFLYLSLFSVWLEKYYLPFDFFLFFFAISSYAWRVDATVCFVEVSGFAWFELRLVCVCYEADGHYTESKCH